ncbi:MAG: MFS transporter [Candidatus Atribacteria bacterium]
MDSNQEKKNKRKIYLDTNLQIIFGITLTTILGIVSISPAFPRMVQELNISVKDIGLLITFFTFPGILLTPILGVFADRLGRKKILIPSLMLFGIAGGACFFVRDFNLLLILRFFQGIGAASLGSINVAMIGDLYSGKERTAAMGYNSSVRSIGSASYPAIGGALAMMGWHYPFILYFIAIPVGLLVLFSLKNPEPKNKQNIKKHLSDVWKRIQNRQIIGLLIIGSVTFIIVFGSYMICFPLLIGHSFGASPLIIGVIMSSMSLAAAFTSSQLGKLARVYSEKTLLKVAFILYALALLMIPFVFKLWVFLIPIIIFGIAHGINIPIIQTLLAGLAPMEYRATFMSISGMTFRVGQTLGPLLMGVMFSIGGIGAPFYAGAFLSVIIVLILVGGLFPDPNKVGGR